MESSRTLEQAYADLAAGGVIFLIAAEPHWSHYDPEECPKPIREWLSAHYPYATVEKLAGLEQDYGFADDQGSRPTASQFLPSPMFRLGLSSDEAAHFQEAWSNPPLHTPDEPNDFHFIVFGSEDASKALGLSLGEIMLPVM